MRVDKFLKVSRVIKRRELANEACKLGMIKVNSRIVKPSYTLKEGDTVEVDTPKFYIKFIVLNIPTGNVRKEEVSKLYKIIEERKKDWLEL